MAYWPLNETSGVAYDVFGGNNLTDNNTVTSATGLVYPTARQYTRANNEYHSIADNDSLSVGDIDFEVEGWAYLDSKPTAMIPFCKWDVGLHEWTVQYIGGGTDRFRFVVENASGGLGIVVANALGSPSTGVWYRIAAWHNSVANTINIQINDGAVNSDAWTTGVRTNGADPFMVGNQSGNYWDGRVGSLAFWKRVRTAAERSLTWNGGTGLAYEQW